VPAAASTAALLTIPETDFLSTYHVQQSENRQFHFCLRGDKHEMIFQSEEFWSKQGALNAIDSCRTHSPHEQNYVRRITEQGSPYFVLRGGHDEVLGVSEPYSSEAARENGIVSCKVNGRGSAENDETVGRARRQR
jgi:uncharacterized protein YegP (UPF0339 family)